MRKTILAAASMCAVCGAWAAELGSLTVYSATGEPFRAQLLVKDVDAANKPQVRLSPASTYQMVGKEVIVSPSTLKLAVVSRNPYTVSISGKDAVKTSTFPLIVELADGDKRSAKLYNIQLKPAVKSAAVRDAAPAPKASSDTAAKAAAVPSVQTVAKTPVPAAVPSAEPPTAADQTKTPAAVPTAQPSAHTTEVSQKLPAARPAADQKPAAAQSAKTGTVSFSDTVRVQPGVTTWSTVKPYRTLYPKASMDQIMVAFVRANPKAFEGGRVNSPKAGSRLTVPTLKRVESVRIDEAYALVRLTPNSDATKRPSAKLLDRAADAIKASSPALYKELQAQRKAETPKTVVKKPAKPEAAAPAAPASAAAVAALVEQKSPQTTTTAPAAAPKPLHDPLADTIAATSTIEPQVKSETKTEAPAQPAPVAEKPVEQKPVEQKTSDSGIGFWLSLLVLIGAAGGGAGWFAYRRLQRRREDAQVMKTVRFMKGAAATDEQLEGVNRMMENRLEADKAAARGFAPLVEKAPEAAAVQTAQPVAEAVQPAVPEAARPAVQAESAPIEKQVESERREPTFAAFPSTPTEPAVRASHSGFSVANAYVDADQHRAEAQSVQSESRQNVDNKLVMARNYIGLGAKLQAVRVLREVLAEGNDAQKAQARELIARLDPVVPTDKS